MLRGWVRDNEDETYMPSHEPDSMGLSLSVAVLGDVCRPC